MRRLLISLVLWLTSFYVMGAEEFLDPSIAFRPSVQALDAQTIEVRFDIATGYYLYKEKINFSTQTPSVALGKPVAPKATVKDDPNFGKVEIFTDRAVYQLPIEAPTSPVLHLKIAYQGCAEAGLCYPPQEQILTIGLPGTSAPPASSAQPDEPSATDETGSIAQALTRSSLAVNLGFFFLAGLGLSLTPCVFPMIPILSGIIAGTGTTTHRRRGLLLSIAYVLGMALTYAMAGIAAGLSGTLISNALQTPWALGGFALIFVGLSLSMFGFYELQLPSVLQNRLNTQSGRFQGGQMGGVFIMGALSALMVGPCVAAPLAGVLLYIGQTGNAWLGGLALFVMALGMGVPLLLIGLSAGTLLPRAGMWMETIKKFFGVALLATALGLVSPILPMAVQMTAWAVLLIVCAVYLRALESLPEHASGWQRLWKGLGWALLIAGSALLIGMLSGQRDPWQPLAGMRGLAATSTATPSPESPSPAFVRIRSESELQTHIQTAQKPVLLDFYADWCTACKEMEHLTLRHPEVKSKLSDYLLLQVDVTQNSTQSKDLLQRFGLFGPPGMVFLDAHGQEIRSRRVVGFQDAEKFLRTLNRP